MSAIVTNVTAIITGALGWLTDTVTAISGEGMELLMFFILVPMLGVGIGLLKRFVK